jgi:hypothetical protein
MPGAASRAEKDARAFCARFPNAVALDPRVTAPLLVTLAYRATWVGDGVGLNERNLGTIVAGKGFGRNVRRRAIALGKALGYLDRPHNSKGRRVRKKGRPHFPRAVDRLHLPEGEGQVVRRSWFDGTATVDELATLFYVRARGVARARQIEQRFGWRRPKAAKAIGSATSTLAGRKPHGLLARGLLLKTRRRAADGTFQGVTYRTPVLTDDRLAGQKNPTVKKRGDGQRGNGQAGDKHILVLHVETLTRKIDGSSGREVAGQVAAAPSESASDDVRAAA